MWYQTLQIILNYTCARKGIHKLHKLRTIYYCMKYCNFKPIYLIVYQVNKSVYKMIANNKEKLIHDFFPKPSLDAHTVYDVSFLISFLRSVTARKLAPKFWIISKTKIKKTWNWLFKLKIASLHLALTSKKYLIGIFIYNRSFNPLMSSLDVVIFPECILGCFLFVFGHSFL